MQVITCLFTETIFCNHAQNAENFGVSMFAEQNQTSMLAHINEAEIIGLVCRNLLK